MLSQETLKKIRLIEIETKRLLSGSFVGDYSSAKKGSGFEFDQIRDYQLGDDVRFIDWKSSARSNKLLVKQYIEERNRTVILAVDISASGFYSTARQLQTGRLAGGQLKNGKLSDGQAGKLKIDILAEVAAVLALVADYGKDKASLILFTDEIEVFIPAASGKKHIHTIMEQLFSYKPKSKKTDINCVFDLLAKVARKDAMVFILSDFITDIPEKKLSLVSRLYDLVAIRCLDKNENSFEGIGFVNIEDIETGESFLLDTRSFGGKSRGLKKLNNFLGTRVHQQGNVFKKFGVDLLDISADKPFVGEMILFFRRRMIY